MEKCNVIVYVGNVDNDKTKPRKKVFEKEVSVPASSVPVKELNKSLRFLFGDDAIVDFMFRAK